jgi:hypothetical protein
MDTGAFDKILAYYRETPVSNSQSTYGGPFGQAYTNKNCCLKCTQTVGCVSWILENNPAAIDRACVLLSSPQTNFEVMFNFNGGNV